MRQCCRALELQDLYANASSFAARLQDGNVVTWGDSPFGGWASASIITDDVLSAKLGNKLTKATAHQCGTA